MCGIFGLSIKRDLGLGFTQWSKATADLFSLSESRGKEAAGIAIATRDLLLVHKDSVSAREMLRTQDYSAILDRARASFFEAGREVDALSAIGHARLVTNGLQGIDANNQPVRRDDVVIVHNGIVVNVDQIWSALADEGITPSADVDTEVIAALLQNSLNEGEELRIAAQKVFARIYGETSIAAFLRPFQVMLLGTNTGSLHYVLTPDRRGFLFASERTICEALMSGPGAIPGFQNGEIGQLRAGTGAILRLDTHELETFPLEGSVGFAAPSVSPMLAAQRAIEDKAERYLKAMRAMQRCTRCLLPKTMPFIAYDADGVCNYCHAYKPWAKRPESDLAEKLDRIRSKDGSPDCIVAFSGGRDSSYGLHLLKTKYRMTPLTFSYDWGMVTDLARRNQARMCGKLGVEHIWISADIKEKRSHIRRNVLAWLKKPDLGLIPLFMAGDKEVLWHANKLMEEYRIGNMVFCTNELEKTVFKQGFLGIDARDTTVHRPSSLPAIGKLGMLWKYGRRFASNAAYFNRSLPDTLFAFFSYYVIDQNYFSLFDFIPWKEDELNQTLIDEYQWETAKDTQSTWRIGDGTAPFYNYIYHSVAGFSEYDTFRSNQIREGELTREQAAALVEQENIPRFESIREYTQLINIDFDETVRIIDRIPKLYLH